MAMKKKSKPIADPSMDDDLTGPVLDAAAFDGDDSDSGSEPRNPGGHDGAEANTGGDQIVFGSDGDDVLDVRADGAAVFACGGDDIIYAGSDDATVDGGDGYDRVQLTGANGFDGHTGVAGGWTGIEEITGTNGGDAINVFNPFSVEGLRIDAGAGNDTVEATSCDDVLIGGAGDDILAGGEGLDTAIFAGRLAEYLVQSNGATVWISDRRTDAVNDGCDRLDGIEVLQFADCAVPVADLCAANAAVLPARPAAFPDFML